jgi:hypothetical protein
MWGERVVEARLEAYVLGGVDSDTDRGEAVRWGSKVASDRPAFLYVLIEGGSAAAVEE